MKTEETLNLDQDLDLIFPIINGKVSMAINRMMYRNFKKEGLDITPEQWTVLALSLIHIYIRVYHCAGYRKYIQRNILEA